MKTTDTRLAKLLLAAALPALLSACQSLQPPRQQSAAVAALYASAAEAGAVAMGRFDADPLLLVPTSSLAPAQQCAGAMPAGTLSAAGRRARCMRTADGQQGWLPLEPSAQSGLPGLPVSQLDSRV